MQNLYFIFDMPHGKQFVGGVASIINKYMEHTDDFVRFGVKPSIIDLSEYNVWFPHMRKVSNFLNMFRQSNGVINKIKKNPNVDIHIHSSMKWTLAKDLFLISRVQKILKGKIILTIHHAVPSNFFYGRLGEKIGIWVIRNYVDKLIVLSEATKTYFTESGIEPGNIMTLYTFHDIADHEIVLTDKSGLVFMGTISRWKGVFELVEAIKLSKYTDFVIHICGTFPNKQTEEEFRNIISGLESRVILHGYVTGGEKNRILDSAAILVLPSRAEGMPVSIMEGMACGCAIVATSVGAIPEVITEKNGILIESEPLNVECLAEAINLLLENKDTLVNMQKENMYYSKEFTVEKHIEQLIEFISK